MWEEQYAVPPGGGSKVFKAMEMLTDKDGNFKISHKTYIAMLPGGEIYGPLIKIFKPGYKYFENEDFGPDTPDASYYPKWWKGYFEKPHATVELVKLKTREERIKNLGRVEPDVEDFHKYKLYMNLVNQERLSLGFEPYPD